MLDKLKNLFAEKKVEDSTDDAHLAELAAAALLIELSHADDSVDKNETDIILRIIKQALNLSETDIDEFFSNADTRRASAISLYEFTDIINQHFDKAAKFELICNLWRVAYADGQIDRYEDHTIRKVAELIYVSHSEFIRAKHLIQESS